MNDAPNVVYGRLLEAAHFTGYGFERAGGALEWLLDDGRWRLVGSGYSDVREFMASIDTGGLSLDQRKTIARKLNRELQLSLREAATAAGIGTTTLHNDLFGRSQANTDDAQAEEPSEAETSERSHANTPVWLDASGSDVADRMASRAHVGHASGENEWYTPIEYIEAARQTMGGIDLDPASTAEANHVVRATTYFTAEQDGLAQEWHGRVWMNPPYAQPLISRFCEKLIVSWAHGVTEACVLVNNATETEWFQTLAQHAFAFCFPNGRVRFWQPGRTAAAPLQGQAIIYIGRHGGRFSEAFANFGFTVAR